MTTKSTQKLCLVHPRTYLPELHRNIEEIRRTKLFYGSTLKELQKRYCSCRGPPKESLFDIDHMKNVCHQIECSSISESTSMSYLVLDFPLSITPLERIEKIGRLIGRGGQQLQLIQNQYNLHINIINEKSNQHIRRIIDQLKKENEHKYHPNALWILINTLSSNDQNKNHIETVKNILINQWKQITQLMKTKLHRTKIISKDKNILSLDFQGDSRWKPKKVKARDMYKKKQYRIEIEVPPQPYIPPISMPKQITKVK